MTAQAPRLLVPTDRHVERALTEVGNGLFGAHVQTLASFWQDAALTLEPDLRIATPEASLLATELAVDVFAQALHLAADAPAATSLALASGLDRTLGMLRRAGVTSAILRATRAPRATLLADLLDAVDEMLAKGGAVDARALPTRVAQAVRRTGFGGAPLVLTGIAAFEPAELDALEAFAAAGSPVRVELPEIGDDAVGEVAGALETRWGSAAAPPDLVWRTGECTRRRSVVIARDAEGECRAAARAVLDALEQGTPPERIAIVVPPADEPLREPLRAALFDARIPHATQALGRSALASPEARIPLLLLTMAARHVARDDVLELLRAPARLATFWLGQRTRETPALAKRLREVPLEIDRTGRDLIEGLSRVVAERPDEAWMPQALTRLLSVVRWLGAATTRRQAGDRLLELFGGTDASRPAARDLAGALEGERHGALALHAMGDGAFAARALQEAVRALVDGAVLVGAADAPLTPGRFVAELGNTLDRGRRGGSRAATVAVGTPHALAGLTHDVVVVLGMADGAYREVEPVDEALRELLPAGSRPPSAHERRTNHGAELAWTLAGAAHLVLVYATGDDAEPVAADPRIVRALADGVERRVEPASRISREASCVDENATVLVGLAHGDRPSADVGERAAIERARTTFFFDPRVPAAAYTGRVDVDPTALRERYGGFSPERPIAVTTIEDAARCPFRAFAASVLGTRRSDDALEAATPSDRGALVHKALLAAFDATAGRLASVNRDVVFADARRAAERAVRLDRALTPLRREALTYAVSCALVELARCIDDADGIVPFLSERAFGRGRDAWPALTLGAADGEAAVFVSGRIDRVDRSVDGLRARVVDYKTGRAASGAEQGKTAFQLPIYARVVAQALGATRLEAAYVRIDGRGGITFAPSTPEKRRALADKADEAGDEARRIVARAWAGDAPPRPKAASTCARCDARDLCRRPAVAPVDDGDEAST